MPNPKLVRNNKHQLVCKETVQVDIGNIEIFFAVSNGLLS
jgi:hypothetical protein